MLMGITGLTLVADSILLGARLIADSIAQLQLVADGILPGTRLIANGIARL